MAGRGPDLLSLAIEHLQSAVEYSRRGRRVFFDTTNPDTLLLVEAELRKAFESLNRLGDPFYHANPVLDRSQIARVRQLLTHDYASLDAPEIWRIVTEEAPRLLRRLARAKVSE